MVVVEVVRQEEPCHIYTPLSMGTWMVGGQWGATPNRGVYTPYATRLRSYYAAAASETLALIPDSARILARSAAVKVF